MKVAMNPAWPRIRQACPFPSHRLPATSVKPPLTESGGLNRASGHYHSDSPHMAALQADLDSAGMNRRFGQNISDDAIGQIPRSLILLQDYQDTQPRLDIGPLCVAQTFGHYPTYRYLSMPWNIKPDRNLESVRDLSTGKFGQPRDDASIRRRWVTSQPSILLMGIDRRRTRFLRLSLLPFLFQRFFRLFLHLFFCLMRFGHTSSLSST